MKKQNPGEETMAITLRRLTPVFGAEITDVDLSRPLDDATFAAIEDAFETYSVLVFPGQDLDDDCQIAFSRRFGELEIHVLDQYLHPQHPEILIVSNVMDGERHVGIYDAGRYWHTDLSYMAVPSRGSVLFAMEVPVGDQGKPLGDTLFTAPPPPTTH